MFIVYIFEVPIIAFVLLFALVANTNVGEMAIIFGGIPIIPMLILCVWSFVSFINKIKNGETGKFDSFLLFIFSVMFIIASVRIFQFGINNPNLSLWDFTIGQLF